MFTITTTKFNAAAAQAALVLARAVVKGPQLTAAAQAARDAGVWVIDLNMARGTVNARATLLADRIAAALAV